MITPTIEAIQACVADHYGIALFEMRSDRRARRVARPRQVAMYLALSTPPGWRKRGMNDMTDSIFVIDQIKQLVADHYGVAVRLLVGPQRGRCIARPRQVAMFMAINFTQRSLPQIGRAFGNRDHTTVMHARRRIEELKESDPDMARDLKDLEAKLLLSDQIEELRIVDLEEAMEKVFKMAVGLAKTVPGRSCRGLPRVLRAYLAKTYGEKTVARARDKAGDGVELMVSDAGSWTLLATDDYGARIVAAGEGWKPGKVPRAPPPKVRTCLKCREEFPDAGGLHLCARCREANGKIDAMAEGVSA